MSRTVSGRTTPAAYPWFQPPPGAGGLDIALPGVPTALAPGLRFNPMVGHAHVFRQQPNPGAPAFAYDVLGLEEYTPIGAGVHNRGQLRIEQPPVIFANLALTPQGLGGLVMGQVISAPLIVPDALMVDLGGDDTPFATS